MSCQQDLQIPPCTFGKERPFLAGDLQHGGAERVQKAVSIAGAESGTCRAGHHDDGLMSLLPARLSQCAALLAVRWNFSESNRSIALEGTEGACDACRGREAAIEER